MQTKPAARRLTGIDAARGVALFGMMSTHVLPLYVAGTSDASWTALLFSGRASGLFAVVAGIGLALLTGGRSPHRDATLSADRSGIAVRAVIIALIGLVLGGVETNIAIILFHYGVLFLVALPFVGLRLRALAAWAAGWLVLAPAAAYLLRPVVASAVEPASLGANPIFEHFLVPQTLTADVFLTGYYPVLQWLGFILVGLAIGRLDLRRLPVQLGLLGAGLVAAVGARLLSAWLLGPGGGLAAILRTPDGARYPLEAMLDVGLAGVDQSGSWWWLAVSAPHSGSTLDLVHVSGCAAAVIALCLVLTRHYPQALLPLSAPGAMTLTLYSLHVCVMSWADQLVPLPDPVQLLWLQVIAAVAIGILFQRFRSRGPLELLTSGAANAAREGRADARR
ncbi:heparan-alpha-glucosaminide N-acetyltransferase domain-containing protein [Arthrobacter agilis]|uniref:heparan-alpha-glucosaminide N-acetyltransferase domain-containing protein n=1 Tax=Arthrobacter agilis TaxID=37921 RepID=UPI0023653752|nr:heparan-alpha-glucosaminide N-acetyltransferase domain-containing protein [Arthrobacter agilis]WDF34408.1 heparan-alpha-glucosaminide N-acetyltransferase domain-containing protein [Arthrobacter agilis]